MELIVRLDGGPPQRLSVDDPSGETWTGELTVEGDGLAGIVSHEPIEVVVHVVSGEGLGGTEARATCDASAGRVVLVGLEPFVVTDRGNSL